MPHALLVIGTAGLLFALWGIKSTTGRRMFDEMAGMIPFYIGVLGAVLVAVALVWLGIRFLSN